MDTQTRWSRIWGIGHIRNEGWFVRFAPNPGFRFGNFIWSLKHGKRRV